uniref:Uncharacterized protein n=1 Tax=Rhizophora mucronata TaxID=61149 RepID=A0A2P2NEZ9_RHIMU
MLHLELLELPPSYIAMTTLL